jgi:hypothetical protein
MLPDIYVLHGGAAADKALADTVVAGLGGLPARLVLMTTEELVLRLQDLAHIPEVGALSRIRQGILARIPAAGQAARILQGTVIVLLSETMLSDGDRRAALRATVGGSSFLDFRHYFICRKTTPQEIRDRFPDLAEIYENVMLRTESELPKVIEDVRHNFTQHNRTSWELYGPGLVLFFGTLVALVLSQVSGRIHSVRFLLVAALAVLLYMHASSTLTVALIVVCLYVVGLGLSWIDPLDLWPWLGRCWKWSGSLDSLHSPRASLLGLGPVTFAGAVSGATTAMLTGDRTPLAIGLVLGLVLQAVTDAACMLRGLSRLRQARGHPADLPVDGGVCDTDHLQGAIESSMTLRSFNLIVVFGPLLVVILISVVGAVRFPWPFAVGWLAAFALGTLTPAIIAVSWLAADANAMRLYGLTTTNLRRAGAIYRRVDRGKVPYALGIDDASLVTFTEQEKEDLTRFAFLQRIAAGQLLRGWFKRPDFAFISYVWSDEEKVKIAERLDETLRGIGIPSFRDTRAIQDPFAAWREHISSALMRCTHFFLVISPRIKNGHVVLREIETVVQRWYLEMLPAVICIVNPEVARELRDEPQVPLQVRFILSCCPQMSISEAADPRQLRHIVEHTRRQGKWNDWLTMLSARAARHRILRMPGIVVPIGVQQLRGRGTTDRLRH